MAWNELTLPFAYTKNASTLIVITFFNNLLINSPNNLGIKSVSS